jgi:hypothetical protein
MIAMFANAMMSAQADQVCGAGYGERSEQRVNRRNGAHQVGDGLAALASLRRRRPPGAALAGNQADLPHEVADQLRTAVLALAGQGGVDAAVAVGAVGGIEDRLDEGGQPSATSRGRRGGSVAPRVEA